MTVPTLSLARLLILCVVAACSGGSSSSQVLTGRIDTSKGAVAIRAVIDGEVVTATPVRTDGSFTLSIPAGSNYRLEVLTHAGVVKNIVKRSGNVLRDVVFKVCDPGNPFDIGGVNDPNPDGICGPNDPNCVPCDPATGVDCMDPCKNNPMDPGCLPPDPCSDPNAPNCQPCGANDPNCQPPSCSPMDPTCDCVVQPDGTCCPPDDPMCSTSCQPGDPNCCDANGNCPPPPCDSMTDPDCKCNADGTCPPLPCDPTIDPMCGCNADGTCGGCTDPNAPGCVPPCMDPTDPNTCKDPCIDDPMTCGCTTPDCWPARHRIVERVTIEASQVPVSTLPFPASGTRSLTKAG
jgi:hypothetical protein